MLASSLALLLAAQQPSWQQHRAWRDEARAAAGECDDPALDLPPMRGINHRVEARRLVAAMLSVDPARCPGVREAALVQIRARLGDPERGEVDLEMLELAWRAAAEGRGMAPDPALADRYGRILWLFDDHPPPLPRWPERARRAWLERPQTVALLAARNDLLGLRTRRSLEAEGLLRLRRGRPYYDPRRGAALLETGMLAFNMENRLRVSRLFTDGVHLPRDYARAARPFLMLAALRGEIAAEPQKELLRIGASPPPRPHPRGARGGAAHPLCRALRRPPRQRRGAGRDAAPGSDAPPNAHRPGDADRIAAVMTGNIRSPCLIVGRRTGPADPRSACAPSSAGRPRRFVAITTPSGAPSRPRRPRRLGRNAADVDLSATARGRCLFLGRTAPGRARPDN